ncbi:nitrile hydratase subunit beta [Cumulibacter soli]|uniref:nitrile hydratase subunit beta n=1 Tax=Cumulibacter soli TaxID=2546344 RepID=UPI001067FB52|nr:nitrile hydratase subunit beta [Cumulibacter soli]
MNGAQDLGGGQNFGPVVPEPDEPAFHHDWERRAMAMTLAIGALGVWNIDQSRHEREKLPPATYLTSSYYRIWILALQNSLDALNLLERTDLTARTAEELVGAFSARASYERPTDTEPAFAVGQRVLTRRENPTGHTRLPRYARGRIGTIAAIRGAHVFPDRNAVPLGDRPDKTPEWLYTVDFAGTELWGEGSDPTLTVSIDAWQPYLQAVSG